MSERLEEAVWREHYRDLVRGVRVICEAVEEALGPLARDALKEQIALSSRTTVEEIFEEVP
jgi:hypothetical protein